MRNVIFNLVERCSAKLDKLFFGKVKRNLLGNLQGTVLELGAGRGVNCKYYPKDIVWIALEPDKNVVPLLEKKVKHFTKGSKVLTTTAEHISLPDKSIDTVVATLVLCSVKEQEKVLNEIKRVLKPKGTFIFLEHSKAKEGTRRAQVQKTIRNVWQRMFGGCDCYRNTKENIKKNFKNTEFIEIQKKIAFIHPVICGKASNFYKEKNT